MVTSVLPEQKAHALQQVLESTTFARSEQLRNFLRLICAMESSGRVNEINEYLIGVEGLGRSPDFVPSTDGIVRSRAHALRQKLFEYYTKENPDALVRIDIPKGSYAPRYVLRDEPEFAEPHPAIKPEATTAALLPAPAELAASNSITRLNWRDIGIGVLVSSLVWGAILLSYRSIPSESRLIDPIIAEAWGPLARADSNTVLVLERPDQYILRSLPQGARLAGVVSATPPNALRVAHDRLNPPRPGQELILSSVSSFRGGQVLGLAAALRILNLAGSTAEILPDRSVPITNLRGRNAMLFGDPNLSPTIARMLGRGAYSVDYDKSINDFVVRESASPGSSTGQTYFPKEHADDLDEYPGLLTVLPSDGSPEGSRRVVIFSAGNSVGSQAAAEFFCSPQSLRDLKERFRREKIAGFPQAYQVVVQGRSSGPSMLSFSYVAHKVLEAQPH